MAGDDCVVLLETEALGQLGVKAEVVAQAMAVRLRLEAARVEREQ